MTKNIVLVGFMGAGKSVVSKQLAVRLKRQRVSTDELIEKKEGKVISDIFRDKGEPYFRDLEKAVVSELATKGGLIIDCGGGIVLASQNVDNLKKNGVMFFLAVSPRTIYERVKHEKHRPLLAVADPQKQITELLVQRKPLYAKADVRIETEGKSVEQICEEIIKRMQV